MQFKNLKFIILIVFFVFYFFSIQSETIDCLSVKLDSLNSKLTEVDMNIKHLNNEKEKIITQIANIKQQMYKPEYDFDSSKGIITTLKYEGALRDKPLVSGNKIKILSAGDTIIVYNEYKKPYFKVSFKNIIGYLSYGAIKLNDTLNEIIDPNYSFKNKRFERLTKKYGSSVASKIMKKKYWIGMTKDMARSSLGSPNEINKTTGSWGIHEQWIYEKKDLYLYFENGKLSSFQD